MPDQNGNYSIRCGNGVTITFSEEEAETFAPELWYDLLEARAKLSAIRKIVDEEVEGTYVQKVMQMNSIRKWLDA